jgi:hypothetical protein
MSPAVCSLAAQQVKVVGGAIRHPLSPRGRSLYFEEQVRKMQYFG